MIFIEKTGRVGFQARRDLLEGVQVVEADEQVVLLQLLVVRQLVQPGKPA